MNVLLASPPMENTVRGNLPPVVEDCSGTYPPLGLLYVAAYAEDVPGTHVDVLDSRAEGMTHDKLADRIRKCAPDIIGVQVMTFTLVDAVMLARTAREAAPDALIVFGGPHPTIFPSETVSLADVDAVVVGEGEYAFTELLKAVAEKHPIEDVRGVYTKKSKADGKPLPSIEFIDDLDVLKIPARHLLNNSLYGSPMAQHRKITTMMSSRGCPYRCVFCNRPQMGKAFRKRSAESVVAEMTHCVREEGVKEILFYDDTFNVDPERVLAICKAIQDAGLKAAWDIRARIETMTPEILTELKKAGCSRIHYGVETGSPKIQKRIRKNLDLDQVRKVFKMTRQAGMEALGYFMIGCPDETLEDMQMTFDIIKTMPMDYAHIGIFTPFPGTPFYCETIESGGFDCDYWAEFAKNPTADFSPPHWNQNFSDQELLKHLKYAYRCFYQRPTYMLKSLFKIRSFNELRKKVGLGLKLLKSMR